MQLLENLHMIEGMGFDGNIYILVEGSYVSLIDTGTGLSVSNIYRYVDSLGLQRRSIKRIVLTHCHIDHSGGLPKIAKDLSPEVCVYETEAPYIESGKGSVILSTMMGVSYPPTKVDVRLKDNESVETSGFKLKVLNTPGHTSGSICLFDQENSVLFSGDTVFADGGFGRVDFPTGDAGALVNSLDILARLEVKHLLPGHMNAVMNEGKRHIGIAARYARSLL